MLKQARFYRWIFACWLALLGTSTTSSANDAMIDRLAGNWNNEESGENIKVERGLAGWDIWISNKGQERISEDTTEGSNIKVEGRGFSCSYYVTMTTDQKMRWQLRKGEPEARCLRGSFVRIEEPAPERTLSVVAQRRTLRPVHWRPSIHEAKCPAEEGAQTPEKQYLSDF